MSQNTQNKPQRTDNVQDMIVKQSSLKAAVEFCDKECTVEHIIMNAEIMLDKNISMDDINFAITNTYKDDVSCLYSDYNSDRSIYKVSILLCRSNNSLSLSSIY